MERRQTSFVSKHEGVSKKIIIHDHSAYGKALEGKQVSRSKKSVINHWILGKSHIFLAQESSQTELFPRMDPIWP